VVDGVSGEDEAPPRPIVWRRAPTTAYVGSPERAVVLDLTRLGGAPYVFEGSAARIWACVDGERTEAEIVDELARSHGLRADAVGRDVRDFLDRLDDLGLVLGQGR
jgi:hypothetical protein